MTRQLTLAIAATLTAVALVVGWFRLTPAPHHTGSPCGPGFSRKGARCLAEAPSGCPAPLVATDHGCDEAEHDVVRIPETTVTIGPSDWEAEGRIEARTFTVRAFAVDRLEVSSGRACASAVFAGEAQCRAGDPTRAAFGVRLDQARAYCAGRGGRLPSEDEWIAAAAGDRPRRYPWGDTGAVCRRAAWGLASGPCAEGADGPDTVGAHPDGATPLGVHDLAGNVAEWVERVGAGDAGVTKGGSWQTRLATDLRTWVPGSTATAAPRGIGFRCAYDQVP